MSKRPKPKPPNRRRKTRKSLAEAVSRKSLRFEAQPLAAAYFIVLERKEDGLDCSMEGKALARASEALEDIAMLHNVRPLTGFTSIDPKPAATYLAGEGLEGNEITLASLP